MSGQPTVQQQQQYLQQVRQQVQSQMMQEVMTKMSEKCFKVTDLFVWYMTISPFTFVIVLPLNAILTFTRVSVFMILLYLQLCAGKKGDHLDTSEAQCVVHCMDRYMETMQVVSSSLQNRQHK